MLACPNDGSLPVPLAGRVRSRPAWVRSVVRGVRAPPGVPAMTTRIHRDQALLLEHVEREARRDVYAAATVEDRERLGLRAREVAGGFVMAADRSDSLLDNRALGLGLEHPLTDEIVHEVVDHYRDGPPGFAINLCPFASSRESETLLIEHGFGTFFHHLKWARGAETVEMKESGVRVEAVGPEQRDEWAALAERVFESLEGHADWTKRVVGRPGWFHYLAYAGDTSIAVGCMYVLDGAAWLGSGGTLADHRRKGAHRALIARRLRDGLDQGVRWFTLETGPNWRDLPGESLRNAARAGFHPVYARPSWIWPLPR